jgi:hypothetical protein
MFTKTRGMKCTNGQCAMFGKMVDKRTSVCKTCNRRNEPDTVPNPPLILGVCLGALVLAGSGAYFLLKGWTPSIPGGGTAQSLSYAIQLDDGGFKNVKETHRFRGGDRLRLLAKASFPAYLYCFHEDSVSGEIDVLPVSSQSIEPRQEVTIPASSTIRMDSQPAPERFTLIASGRQLPELEFGSRKIAKSEFESVVSRVTSGDKSRSAADGEWTKVEGASKENPLLKASFTLKHE